MAVSDQFAYNMDWAAAQAELKRAVELNPGSVDAHYDYAQYLSTQGQVAESIAESRRSSAG